MPPALERRPIKPRSQTRRVTQKIASNIAAKMIPATTMATAGSLVAILAFNQGLDRALICVLILIGNAFAHVTFRSGRHSRALTISLGILSIALVLGTWNNGGVIAPAFAASSIVWLTSFWLYSKSYVRAVELGICLLGVAVVAAERNPTLQLHLSPAVLLTIYMLIGFVASQVLTSIRQLLFETLDTLQQQQDQVRAIFGTLDEGIVLLGSGQIVRDSNPQGTRLIEAIETSHGRLMNLPLTWNNKQWTLGQLLERPEGLTGARFQLASDSGHDERAFEVHSHTLQLEMGPETVLTIRDITAMLAQQRDQQLSHRLHTAEQLTRTYAHDLNNILATIGVASEVLEETVSHEHRYLIDMVKQSVDKASVFTKRLELHHATIDTTDHTMDISACVRSTCELLKRTLPDNIQITFQSTLDRCEIRFNPTIAESIFANMGINAADAMPRGGELRFAIAVVEDASFLHPDWTLPPGPLVKVTIQDTGEGIEPETLTRIFEPFFTTKPFGIGSGINLSASRTVVRKHGGDIFVQSEVSRGTTFHVLLPFHPETLVRQPTPPKTFSKDHKLRVLLIDDEQAIRKVIRLSLEAAHTHIVEAETGEKAIDLLDQGTFDLILLDLQLPGQGGHLTMQRLQSMAQMPPVIIMSGLATSTAQATALSLGAVDVLHKPFRRKTMLQAIRAVYPGLPTMP